LESFEEKKKDQHDENETVEALKFIGMAAEKMKPYNFDWNKVPPQ